MSHYYQHAAAKIREGALVMQGLDNQRNLAAFLARQQRIKARQQQAQNTGNTIASKITIEVANERLKWANSFERPLVLIELYSLMNRQEWFKLFTKEWSGCDGCYRIKKELSLILDTNLTEMMTAASEEVMTTWQSLPDELTVYRGCYKNNKKGLSWTLDKNTALQFPTFIRYKQKGQALLLIG